MTDKRVTNTSTTIMMDAAQLQALIAKSQQVENKEPDIIVLKTTVVPPSRPGQRPQLNTELALPKAEPEPLTDDVNE
jgi:hypothetical protein